MTQVITAPPPEFHDLTKREVIETLQRARRSIKSEEEEYICLALAYAHLGLSHERRWKDSNAYGSSLIKWVQSLIEGLEMADDWLMAKEHILTDEQMRHWRTQWLTLLIDYVIQHPQKFFKNLQVP